MNNKNSQKENTTFVLNDIIKRKILDLYKISKPEDNSKDDAESSQEK